DGLAMLDLDYPEDSRADVDFNVVGTDAGTYVEIQGTAEGKPFDRQGVGTLMDLADSGLQRLFAAQAEILATVPRGPDVTGHGSSSRPVRSTSSASSGSSSIRPARRC